MSTRDIQSRIRCKFWEETLAAWNKIINVGTITGESILFESLWLNKNVKMEANKSIPMKKLIKCGILRVKDLYKKEMNTFMNPTELAQKYKFGHFLLWNAVLKAIPREWIQIIQNDVTRMENERLKVYEELQNVEKTAKWSYPLLTKNSKVTYPENAQRKWKNDLGISEVTWSKVYKHLYAITDDVRLKWLQFRILHRIIPTNKALRIFGIKDSSKCERCSDPCETILHVFWNCKYAREFWSRLKTRLLLTKPLSPRDIILGNDKGNGALAAAPLRFCILIGKEFIWQCRNAGTTPDVDRFFIKLIKYISVEKCIAINKGTMAKFVNRYGDVIRVMDL